MTEYITAGLTVLTGIAVLVIGQFILKIVAEPIQDQTKAIGEIAFALTYYANVFLLPEPMSAYQKLEPIDETSQTLRKLASQLRVSLYVIPFYGLFQIFKLVPKKKAVLEASHCLIGWSNSLYQTDSQAHGNFRDCIADKLHITR